MWSNLQQSQCEKEKLNKANKFFSIFSHLVHLSVDVVLVVVEMEWFAIKMETASIHNSVSPTNVDWMKFSTDVVQVVKELAQILVLFACLIINLAASRNVNALFLMVLFETVLEIVFLRLNVRVKILQVSRFFAETIVSTCFFVIFLRISIFCHFWIIFQKSRLLRC